MHLLSYVYFVFALAETLVLFASVVGLSVLAVRLVVERINSLVDAAIDSSWSRTEPRVKRPGRLSVAVQSGSHEIPGGHNERL